MKTRPVFESYNKFVNSLNIPVNEASKTSEGGATITPLGETGISVVTFAKDTTFSAPDTKPYILLLADSVQFQGFVDKPSAKTVTVTLESNEMDKKGVFKTVSTASEDFTRTQLISGTSLTVAQSITLISEIVKALYVYNESVGVSKERVMQTIKAMKIIKNDYSTEIAKNSLFTNLYKKMVEVNNSRNETGLRALLGKERPGNEKNVLEGAVAAFTS